AEVVDADPSLLRELAAEQRHERLHARLDGRETERQRVARGDTQPDLAGHVALPVLETPGIAADRVGVRAGPRRRLEVDERRLERADRVPPHVEKAGAARTAQILAPGRREHVAAD